MQKKSIQDFSIQNLSIALELALVLLNGVVFAQEKIIRTDCHNHSQTNTHTINQ